VNHRRRASDFPAERAFPVSVVVGHGLLASATFTLVLLTMLGVGGT
jgi:manganese efflux pump family protein